MSGTIIFAHANGFPAGTYQQLFKAWCAAGWRVCAPPMLGHDARYPVTSNWPHLRDELTDYVAAQAPQGAYLVGHWLGGLLSLLVACRRPTLWDIHIDLPPRLSQDRLPEPLERPCPTPPTPLMRPLRRARSTGRCISRSSRRS